MTTYSARPRQRFNLQCAGSTEESDRGVKITRFAPSTTGPAHLGTLYAALIAWLFARSQGGRAILRLENLDPQRCKEAYLEEMVAILRTCGLNFDQVQRQDARTEHYQAALEGLAARDRVYVCRCSRKRTKALGQTTPEGGFGYDNHCRSNLWHGQPYEGSLRLRLDHDALSFVDHLEHRHTTIVAELFGDPIIKRRDGAFAYHFASTLDDADAGVTDVVRGRDLVWSTPPQIALRNALGLPIPQYHHHALLLESQSQKLAKLHGSLPAAQVLDHRSPEELVGLLAWLMGLLETPEAIKPDTLIATFSWQALPRHDWLVSWQPPKLSRAPVDWSRSHEHR